MPASGRQAKRPFQASITSYFPITQSTSLSPSQPIYAQCTPPLPAAIQSSLLNVGMRIRKSVPEGYKTGTYCGLDAVADGSSSPHTIGGAFVGEDITDRRLAELTPYCGIMKVGGYALQRNDSDRKSASLGREISEAFDSNRFDFPSGSQDSTISTLSTESMPPVPRTVNLHKRRLEDESEYEIGESPLSPFIYEDSTPPPASLPNYSVSQISVTNINLSRPLAQPRSRKRAHQIAISRAAKSYTENEENMEMGMGAPIAQCGDDFDEADFLLPYSWGAVEVEMTGI
ncbi:hypothetical protein FGG08_003593 [Glutinoglossum americanum]|uniref:Uncharacterized protein n=1 Tax=Glutinoglossum americanum TaxID=1670608 RepID=A0A9P8L3H9_9PEZI|nr:hypothetical protein FGG08_003593 [Glutinoglossum americanum]